MWEEMYNFGIVSFIVEIVVAGIVYSRCYTQNVFPIFQILSQNPQLILETVFNIRRNINRNDCSEQVNENRH